MGQEGGHMLRCGDRSGDVGPSIVQKPIQKGDANQNNRRSMV